MIYNDFVICAATEQLLACSLRLLLAAVAAAAADSPCEN